MGSAVKVKVKASVKDMTRVPTDPMDLPPDPGDPAPDPADLAADPTDLAADPADLAADPADLAADPADPRRPCRLSLRKSRKYLYSQISIMYKIISKK